MARKRLPHIDFDSLDSDVRLWFLAVFHRDIREAKTFANRAVDLSIEGIDDQDPSSPYCSAHDAAIVRYARCFLACRLPDGAATTRLPERYSFPGAELAILHQRIIAGRHGLVAHADMRERQVTLTKHHDNQGERGRWTINTSGGNLTPRAMSILSGMCESLRQTVVKEIGPLIEARLAEMKVGETIYLGSKGGGIYWCEQDPEGYMQSQIIQQP